MAPVTSISRPLCAAPFLLEQYIISPERKSAYNAFPPCKDQSSVMGRKGKGKGRRRRTNERESRESVSGGELTIPETDMKTAHTKVFHPIRLDWLGSSISLSSGYRSLSPCAICMDLKKASEGTFFTSMKVLSASRASAIVDTDIRLCKDEELSDLDESISLEMC